MLISNFIMFFRDKKKDKRLAELVEIRKKLIYKGCWDGMSCETCDYLYPVKWGDDGKPHAFSCLREDCDNEILKLEGIKDRLNWRDSKTLTYLDKFEMDYYDQKHPGKIRKKNTDGNGH